MPYEVQSTPEELKESKRRCWWIGCKKTAYFDGWTGYRNCFEHWRMDYKYGSCCGLWFALRHTRIINLDKLLTPNETKTP